MIRILAACAAFALFSPAALAQEGPGRDEEAAASVNSEAAPAPDTSNFVGDWRGEVGTGDDAFTIDLIVRELEDGRLQAVGENNAAGISGIESREINLDGDRLRIAFRGASFRGTWDETAQQWTGVWGVGEDVQSMTLHRP